MPPVKATWACKIVGKPEVTAAGSVTIPMEVSSSPEERHIGRPLLVDVPTHRIDRLIELLVAAKEEATKRKRARSQMRARRANWPENKRAKSAVTSAAAVR